MQESFFPTIQLYLYSQMSGRTSCTSGRDTLKTYHLRSSPVKTEESLLESIPEETSKKAHIRSHLFQQVEVRDAVFFKNINVLKDKERLRKYLRLKTKEKWQLSAICDPSLDLVQERRNAINDISRLDVENEIGKKYYINIQFTEV